LTLTIPILLASIYQLPLSSQLDPPLQPNGCLKLGYGIGDDAPFVYTLRERQDVEVGFLKLFLSTEYLDLSGIPQLSPFTSVRRLDQPEVLFTSTLDWNAVSVTVVLRKR
jgi:hypothetical protein